MLNTQGCNILDGIPREQYTECLDLIRDLILGKCDVAQKKGNVEFQVAMFSRGRQIAASKECTKLP